MLKEIVTRHNPSAHMGPIGQSDLPEKVCKIGHGTVNTRERMWQERGCHKRVGERPCARNGEHSRPPPSPSEENGPLEERRRFPCSSCRQIIHELDGFGTPSSAAPVARKQLGVLPFLIHSCSGAHNAVHSSSSRARHPRRGQDTPAPWNSGRPDAKTSTALSSQAGTAMFMSTNFALHRTVAPASRQTLASVRSGASARVRSLPECGQAALWRPRQSKTTPHSHLASVTGNGTRNLSKINTRKRPGSILNSGLVGHP